MDDARDKVERNHATSGQARGARQVPVLAAPAPPLRHDAAAHAVQLDAGHGALARSRGIEQRERDAARPQRSHVRRAVAVHREGMHHPLLRHHQHLRRARHRYTKRPKQDAQRRRQPPHGLADVDRRKIRRRGLHRRRRTSWCIPLARWRHSVPVRADAAPMGSGGALLPPRAAVSLLLLAAAMAAFPTLYRSPGAALVPFIATLALLALLLCAFACPDALEDAVAGLWFEGARRPRVPSGPAAIPADLPELVGKEGSEAAPRAGGPGVPASRRRARRRAAAGLLATGGGDVGPPPDAAAAPTSPRAVVRLPQPATPRGDGELAYHAQLGLVPHSVAERWSEHEGHQARAAPAGDRARCVQPRQRVHVAL